VLIGRVRSSFAGRQTSVTTNDFAIRKVVRSETVIIVLMVVGSIKSVRKQAVVAAETVARTRIATGEDLLKTQKIPEIHS
jgi:hypothetical protein